MIMYINLVIENRNVWVASLVLLKKNSSNIYNRQLSYFVIDKFDWWT